MSQETERRSKRIQELQSRHKQHLESHLNKVLAEAFPAPRHDQETDVGVLIKKMLINRLVQDAFNAGWKAAGKAVP